MPRAVGHQLPFEFLETKIARAVSATDMSSAGGVRSMGRVLRLTVSSVGEIGH